MGGLFDSYLGRYTRYIKMNYENYVMSSNMSIF